LAFALHTYCLPPTGREDMAPFTPPSDLNVPCWAAPYKIDSSRVSRAMGLIHGRLCSTRMLGFVLQRYRAYTSTSEVDFTDSTNQSLGMVEGHAYG